MKFLTWVRSALPSAFGVVSHLVCLDGSGDFAKVPLYDILPDLSDFATIEDIENFLTQEEIEALPGFGGGSGGYEFVQIVDLKAYEVGGGTFTSGAPRTRDLNTITIDETGDVSIPSNGQFALPAGDWIILARAPALRVNGHVAFLYNYSDSSVEIMGGASYCDSSIYVQTDSFIEGGFSIAAPKTFEIRHECNASFSTIGFGGAPSVGGQAAPFTVVNLWRLVS